MIIFTIVYPSNDRLAKGAEKAIYERFGVRPLLSSRQVVQYAATSKRELILNLPLQQLESFTKDNEIAVYRLARTRNSDVPLTVESMPSGSYGITTEDVYQNYKLGMSRRGTNMLFDSLLTIESYLDFGLCRVSILGRAGTTIGPSSRIASKPVYKNLALDFFEKQSIVAEVTTDWSGELEGLPELGLADFIVDNVETGNSARENGLIEYAKIMDSRAIWIEKLFR